MAAERTLLEQKAEILRGVDDRWGPLLDDSALDAALAAVDAAGDAAAVAPPPPLILEALRYGGPDDVAVVVIGQDPYPGSGDAQGLCFSVPRGRAVPESLRRVFGCLDRAGLRRARDGACGDLRPWAAQGVLLLNAALTTRAGARRAHAEHWAPFVGALLDRLCARLEAAGRRAHFLLWGADARAYAPLARRHGHAAREWTHPSPMADNRLPEHARFRACPHFEEVNAALAAEGRRPVVWDNLAPVVAFTDGSCPLNGKPGVRAGFAAVLTGGPFGGAVVCGEARPRLYALADDADPERGLADGGGPATPTNNRGEYLGLVYALLALLRGRALGRVEVVSDSEVAVKTLLEYLPARLRKGTEAELKNFDLVSIAWRLLAALRAQAAAVVLTHTRSHRPEPPRAPARPWLVWAGNARADRHASAPLEGPPTYAVEVLGPAPPVVAALATPGE